MEVRREKWRVTEMRDGCIYKMEMMYSKWFDIKDAPETFSYNEQNEFWIPTTDARFPELERYRR